MISSFCHKNPSIVVISHLHKHVCYFSCFNFSFLNSVFQIILRNISTSFALSLLLLLLIIIIVLISNNNIIIHENKV